MKKIESVFLVFALLSVALTACAPASTPIPSTENPVPTPTPTQPTAIPSVTPTVTPTVTPSGPFPTGIYKADYPLMVTDLIFREDGTFTRLIPSEDVTITGTYEVTGDQIVLNEDPRNPCFGVPGTYIWSFDGTTLTLRDVKDECQLRRYNLRLRTWTRQP